MFLLIVGLFVAPLAAAWLLVGRWQPAGLASHGELLSPPQPVPYLRLPLPDGRELTEAWLQGRWTLAYAGRTCDSDCRMGLYHIRQVHLALGRHFPRVQELLLLSAPPDGELQAWLDREHAAMTAGWADQVILAFFAQAFPGPESDGGWIYLIDPLGNLVLRYAPAGDPGGMLKDLNRLLKLSRIG